MTYVAAQQIHQRLTLYRGEYPERLQDVLAHGIGGRLGNVDQVRLMRLPLDLLAHLGYAEIAQHVLGGSHGSPFTSWTGSRNKAAWYALDGGRRPHGLLLEVTLHLRRRSSWTNLDGTWSVAYQDARGRQLVPTGGFGALTERAVSFPEEGAAIRALGNSDREYVVMGRIEPYEIRACGLWPPRRSGGCDQAWSS